MKRILYLSFYFEPDLCAGSFRNSPLAKELALQFGSENEVVVITTQPNRYNSFKVEAAPFEKFGNLIIHRISIPEHKSGFLDQIHSFRAFYNGAKKIYTGQSFDLVFASSSRLFTAYLGYLASKTLEAPLYLDIRDIFTDTMKDVIRNPLVKMAVLPFMRYIEKRTFSNAKHINLISAGFKSYFSKYTKPTYSYFTNGIDDEFVDIQTSPPTNNTLKKIVYAGNIGEGQGLHNILPFVAKKLEDKYEFLVIGDGGAKSKLVNLLQENSITNVTLVAPVKRDELKKIYNEADFYFLHLNDYEAFKKVLPSKIFELGAYDKPIIAGVAGYANSFIAQYVTNSILFNPGDHETMFSLLQNYQYKKEVRVEFKNKFKRANLNREMAASILKYIN